MEKGTFQLKSGLAEMLKGGVIMDVTTPEQAKIAQEAGACAVMALERVPADIRKAGGVVLHVPITFAPGYDEITRHPYGILKGVVDSTSFVRGSWGAEICEQLTPVEGDIIIEGKRGLDAFGSTNLDFVLRSKGIETVALAGFLTNCCVESTMRSAYEKGFEVLTITDAVGATSPEEHANAIQYDYPMFSKPMSTDEFVASLSEDKELADSSRGY